MALSPSLKKISAAQKATLQMDDLLIPAISELQFAVNSGNGAAIYFDVSRVRSAMVTALDNIRKAQAIAAATDWPTDADYDHA